jgi:murein DD-endopeptidase MepM/ murein hydrolase activator NlpD
VLRWPVPNAVLTQKFGPSPYVFEPAYASYPHFHAGLDLAAASGTPVLSAAEGVVLLATAQRVGDRYAGYGNYVVIEHAGGLRTLYAHLLGSVVQPGEQVHAGQVLGFMGSTGNSTGPHTHFEARVDNTPIDPLILLPAAR